MARLYNVKLPSASRVARLAVEVGSKGVPTFGDHTKVAFCVITRLPSVWYMSLYTPLFDTSIEYGLVGFGSSDSVSPNDAVNGGMVGPALLNHPNFGCPGAGSTPKVNGLNSTFPVMLYLYVTVVVPGAIDVPYATSTGSLKVRLSLARVAIIVHVDVLGGAIL